MPTSHSLSVTAATLLSSGFLVIALIAIYIGAAVAVALFHPERQRRTDARAVLRCLVSILTRRR